MKLHLFLSQTPTPSISHNLCSTFPSCFINYQSLLCHWNDFRHLHPSSLTNRAPYVSSLIPSGLFSIHILPITNRSCLLPSFETLIYLCFPDSLPDSSLHLPEGAYATFFASSFWLLLYPKVLTLVLFAALNDFSQSLYINGPITGISPQTSSSPPISLYHLRFYCQGATDL